jgi:hypothetical protein
MRTLRNSAIMRWRVGRRKARRFSISARTRDVTPLIDKGAEQHVMHRRISLVVETEGTAPGTTRTLGAWQSAGKCTVIPPRRLLLSMTAGRERPGAMNPVPLDGGSGWRVTIRAERTRGKPRLLSHRSRPVRRGSPPRGPRGERTLLPSRRGRPHARPRRSGRGIKLPLHFEADGPTGFEGEIRQGRAAGTTEYSDAKGGEHCGRGVDRAGRRQRADRLG